MKDELEQYSIVPEPVDNGSQKIACWVYFEQLYLYGIGLQNDTYLFHFWEIFCHLQTECQLHLSAQWG